MAAAQQVDVNELLDQVGSDDAVPAMDDAELAEYLKNLPEGEGEDEEFGEGEDDMMFFQGAQVIEFGEGEDFGDYGEGEDVDDMFFAEAVATDFSVQEEAHHHAIEATEFIREDPIGEGELKFGFYELQGMRNTMEDAHKIEPQLAEGGDEWFAAFAVYDGHGGDVCSKYAAEHLLEHFKSDPAHADNVEEALKNAFAKTEAGWIELATGEKSNDGTTAVVAVVKGTTLVVMNVGDSEAVLARNGEAVLLTTCHNPAKNPAEVARVESEGGTLLEDRLCHPHMKSRMFTIAVSRAIGDIMYKTDEYTNGDPSGLSAIPDSTTTQLVDEDQFLILACDGVWDVLNYQDAVDLVLRHLAAGEDAMQITKVVVERAYALGSTDNITACVVFF